MKNASTKSIALHTGFALALAILVAFVQIRPFEYGQPIGDAYDYLTVASDLQHKGVFTDGAQARDAVATGPQGEGLFFSPLYPAAISAFLMLDEGFSDSVSCLLDHRAQRIGPEGCTLDYGWFLAFQALAIGLSIFMVWLAAHAITQDRLCAWLALAMASICGIYGYYAQNFYVESLVVLFFSAFCLMIVLAIQKPQAWRFFGVAVFAGLTVLVRPAFTYPYYGFLAVTLAVFIFGARSLSLRKKALCLLAAIAGYGLVTGPWIVRNGMLFDLWTVSAGYAPFILVQRVSYNAMSWTEIGAAFIYWLPDFGDGLAKALFDPASYEKLDFAHPQGYYLTGKGAFKLAAIEAAGGREKLMGYLLHHHVLADLPKHIAVTFALLWRGIWIEKYWGLICLPLLLGVLACQAHRRVWLLLAFSAPALLMAGIHAFVSVSIPRYNIVMVPALSIGAAIALAALLRFIIGKIAHARHRKVQA